MAIHHPSSSSSSSSPSFSTAVFVYRILFPVILIFASIECFTLPNLPYLLAFLLHQRKPAFAIPVNIFPITQLIILACYALLIIIAHIIIAILISSNVFSVDSISTHILSSLAIPNYQQSIWKSIRFLLPHALIFIITITCLFMNVPSVYPYHGRPYIIAWFYRRRRKLKKAQSLITRSSSRRSRIPIESSYSESSSSNEDNSQSSNDHNIPSTQPFNKYRFPRFMASYGGIFWCCVATALTAVSYSSLLTFVFLIVFSIVIISWALNDSSMRPLQYPSRCLKIVTVFRIYISVYLVLLITFQLPILVRFREPEYGTVSQILKFVGLVPIDTSKPAGWTAVIAVSGAFASYIFTGIFATALSMLTGTSFTTEQVTSADDLDSTLHPRTNFLHTTPGRPVLDVESQSNFYDRLRLPTHYELQILVLVMYLSSIGLITWSLVFPGILTLPLLIASFSYMSFKRARTGNLVDYFLLYAFLLQMGHYVLMAAMDAFRTSSDSDLPVVRLLGLRTLGLQFSVNMIQTIAMILLCINISSKRYLQVVKNKLKQQTHANESIDIHELVLITFRQRRTQDNKTMYSPLKLCIDQIALASLYVSGGLDISALNAVFLLALAIVCFLQSFGLFRRPRVFQVFWSAVFGYSMAFLFITSTLCRSIDGFWECRYQREGLQSGNTGQVVAYAITTVLASVQINFTWSHEHSPDTSYSREFNTAFWKFLRKYFLQVAYIILLFYPLVFPANFLSYGYVLFLFFSILVELILPSIRNFHEVRQLIRRYWILVIAFSAAAMISRYFIRLQWFKEKLNIQKWFFGLGSENTTKFRVTIGDAIVLIVMSLQGRLFVVDSIVRDEQNNNDRYGSSLDELGSTSETFSNSFRDEVETSENASINNDTEIEGQEFNDVLDNDIDNSFIRESISDIPGRELKRIAPHRSRSQARFAEKSHHNLEINNAENRRRQAMQLWRTVRESAPVRGTRIFLERASKQTIVVLRKVILSYSYVIEAMAILAASIWLVKPSVFGFMYIIIGCISLLTEQPTSRIRGRGGIYDTQEQWMVDMLQTIVIILSFALLSVQYMYLMIVFIAKVPDSGIFQYFGLQSPENNEQLPIMVDAVLGHVVVLLTAVLHKVSRQWGKRNEEKFKSERNDTLIELENAVPLEKVFPGVGGDQDSHHSKKVVISTLPEDPAETMSTEFDPAELLKSSSSSTSSSSEPLKTDFILSIRKIISKCFKLIRNRAGDIASLLLPFWSTWGFDMTLSCTVITAVATNSIFSVIYAALVLGIGGVPISKARARWHHFGLIFSFFILLQYGLTLGKPVDDEEKSILLKDVDKSWSDWLFLSVNDPNDRKVALTFGFLTMVLAGITLNEISPRPRKKGFWFSLLAEEDIHNQNTSTPIAPLISNDRVENDNSADKSVHGEMTEDCNAQQPSAVSPQQESQIQDLNMPDDIKFHSDGNLVTFVSGLGQPLQPKTDLNPDDIEYESRDEEKTSTTQTNRYEHDEIMLGQSPLLSSSRRPSGDSGGNRSSFEEHFLKPGNPRDFTRRPIAFGNAVKLHWMRFSGPLVQLFIFAVATVETNVVSAFLLFVAFSFLFKFPNIKAKTSQFLFLRYFIIGIILIFVLSQAPFTDTDRALWLKIFGFYDRNSPRGTTFIALLVALWVTCQIQGRLYGSNDYSFVERYSIEDAKLRFKRAVHEHNGRKYEKMLSKNNSERSRIAREGRLDRLEEELLTKNRGVDAMYKVCVLDEIELLRKKVDKLEGKTKRFSFNYINEDATDEELKAKSALSKFIRKLIGGRSWKKRLSQSLISEVQSFIMRYSSVPVYITMLIAVIANPSVLTMVYPLIIFLYLILEQPRPPKLAWTVVMIYTCICITVKYVLRSPDLSLCTNEVPFFGFGSSSTRDDPSVDNFRDCAIAAGIGFEIFILLALLGHRAVLFTRGVWDLQGSEEQMLLNRTIRGRKCDTSEEMMSGHQPLTENEPIYDHNSIQSEDQELLYTAAQQCDDAAHVLNQARKDTISCVYAGSTDVSPKADKSAEPQNPTDLNLTALGFKDFNLSDIKHVQKSSKNIEAVATTSADQSEIRGEPLPEGGYWPLLTQTTTDVSLNEQENRPNTAPPPGRHHLKRDDENPFQKEHTMRMLRGVPRMLIGNIHPAKTEDVKGDALTFLTPGQTQMNEALTPLAFPKQTETGPISKLRAYFLRLTKENDHKAIGDYYLATFLVDFISFIYVMFGFSNIFREANSTRVDSWWTTNFIETKHLLTLLVMFTAIILDRVCYLTRSMTGKLVLQYVSVIVYHVFLFVFQRNIGKRPATRFFYILRCIYFFLSGLQLRDGYPMYTTAQFLLRNFSTPGIVIFEIYIFIPYLWLCRTLLDWAVVPTSLEIFQYFRFIDIYMWLYRNRAVNRSRGAFRRILGQRRRPLPRIYQGFGLFFLCVLALFLPFIIFSIFNPFFRSRKLSIATLDISLRTNTSSSGRVYPIFSRSSVIRQEPLNRKEQKAAAEAIGVESGLDVGEREQVYQAWFSPLSESVWDIPIEDREELIASLLASGDDSKNKKPHFSFSLSVSSTDRDVFGTSPGKAPLKSMIAERLASAISNRNNFAEVIEYPLARYSILQAGTTVFSSLSQNETPGYVCMRLINYIQPESDARISFWSVSDCNSKDKCSCSNDTRVNDTNAKDLQHIMQIADVSDIQVGGATILSLYIVILFTLANLMKRMFSDKRLIIPYIDMPYTLHLYQLVLDIMYARQDGRYDLEEVLYNRLIDIYRDQHEMVRWSGERALKVPEAWWKKNKYDDPFRVYPSFAETSTEPYLNRKVD